MKTLDMLQSYRLPSPVAIAIKEAAETANVSKSEIVRRALAAYLANTSASDTSTLQGAAA